MLVCNQTHKTAQQSIRSRLYHGVNAHYLARAVSRAAEVTGVVIAVGLVLGLQPSAVLVGHHRAIMLHTAHCAVLQAAAT